MKCFVYFYNTDNTRLINADCLVPNEYYLRVFIGSYSYIEATFFSTDENNKVNDILIQPVPSLFDTKETRMIYWKNLACKMELHGIDELDVNNFCNELTEEIKEAFSNYKLNIH